MKVKHDIKRLEMDMGHFEFEYIARGISKERLFRWYFDYSSEDVGIIKKRGDGSLVSRRVVFRKDNEVIVENEHLVRGKITRITYRTLIHPLDFASDVKIMGPKGESQRHYVFSDIPEGTKIVFSDSYTVRSLYLKIADLFGFIKRRLAKTSAMTMKAYVAEAENVLREENAIV